MELVARVKAMLRRYLALGTLAGAPARENVVTLGDVYKRQAPDNARCSRAHKGCKTLFL